MRQVYYSIQTDISNVSLSDLATTLWGTAGSWVNDNIKDPDKNLYNIKLIWFSDTTPTPGGIATINTLDYGKSLFSYSSLFFDAYSVTEAIKSSTEINSNNLNREAFVNIGSNIAGSLGGIALGIGLGAFASPTGPGTIFAIGIGIYAGTYICGYIGGVLGGICYDIYHAYNFYKYIQNINNYSNKFQNSIQY